MNSTNKMPEILSFSVAQPNTLDNEKPLTIFFLIYSKKESYCLVKGSAFLNFIKRDSTLKKMNFPYATVAVMEKSFIANEEKVFIYPFSTPLCGIMLYLLNLSGNSKTNPFIEPIKNILNTKKSAIDLLLGGYIRSFGSNDCYRRIMENYFEFPLQHEPRKIISDLRQNLRMLFFYVNHMFMRNHSRYLNFPSRIYGSTSSIFSLIAFSTALKSHQELQQLKVTNPDDGNPNPGGNSKIILLKKDEPEPFKDKIVTSKKQTGIKSKIHCLYREYPKEQKYHIVLKMRKRKNNSEGDKALQVQPELKNPPLLSANLNKGKEEMYSIVLKRKSSENNNDNSKITNDDAHSAINYS